MSKILKRTVEINYKIKSKDNLSSVFEREQTIAEGIADNTSTSKKLCHTHTH